LHSERVARSDASPSQWLLLTHGIYGAGMNWRSIARAVTDQRRDWGVLLVDLRHHGHSTGGEPPDTIAACANDLSVLVNDHSAELPVRAIAGHSFGGKVVLAARAAIAPRQTWMLDSSPSPRPDAAIDPTNTVARVLALMESMPPVWTKRDDFISAVTAAGFDLGLARWLAMNVVPGPDGVLRNRLELGAIRAMLDDYYATDLWPALEAPTPGDVHVVAASTGSALSAADQGRLAASPPHVHVHPVTAGHWLHIDAPAAVIALFAANLPA
jgi:pimeloyl-ACP methyl ester carboxylesterase